MTIVRAWRCLRPRRHTGVSWRFRSLTAFAAEWLTDRARGERRKRWAAEKRCLATERLPPPPIFSLSLIRQRSPFRRRRQEVAESPPRQ